MRRYPFYQSADSLVKFVISDIYKIHDAKKINEKLESKQFKQHFFNTDSKINHDSIFKICFKHLESKIGTELMCNNVDLFLNSFSTSKVEENFSLSMGFSYPILKLEKPIRNGTSRYYFERIVIRYKYSVDSEGIINISYPENIPECNGKKDCNILITRQNAEEILNHWGLIKKDDTLIMIVNGLNWEIKLASNNWEVRMLKIDIQTGKLWDFKIARRID